MAHYYACKFGLNRLLRTDGDIRQKAAITAIMENVVIAIYRLRPIQICTVTCDHLLFCHMFLPVILSKFFSVISSILQDNSFTVMSISFILRNANSEEASIHQPFLKESA